MRKHLLAIALFACAGAPLASQEYRITGFEHEDGVHRYRVTRRDLHKNPAWDPETQPLRFDLRHQITRAREACLRTNETSGKIVLWEVRFRRDYERLENEYYPSNATNYWFVEFGFQLTKPGTRLRLREVVMLLDGTLASETLEPIRARPPRLHAEAPPNQDYFRTLADKDADILTQSPGFASPNDVYRRLNAKDFIPPPVQWQPFTQEFPLNLAKEERRAKKRLLEEMNVKDELMLREIRLSWYFPPVASKDDSQFSNADRTDWFLSCDYWTPARPEPLEYSETTLLDGTRFQDSVRLWPWVDVDPNSRNLQ